MKAHSRTRSLKLNPNSIKVILALHKQKKGMTSWQLKKQAKLHERTVERALKRLARDSQYIQALGKTAKNGTIYTITEDGKELSRKRGELD